MPVLAKDQGNTSCKLHVLRAPAIFIGQLNEYTWLKTINHVVHIENAFIVVDNDYGLAPDGSGNCR